MKGPFPGMGILKRENNWEWGCGQGGEIKSSIFDMLKVMSHWKCGEDGCIYKSVTEQRGHSWRWGEDTLYGTAVSQGVQDGNRERDSPPGGRGRGGQGR